MTGCHRVHDEPLRLARQSDAVRLRHRFLRGPEPGEPQCAPVRVGAGDLREKDLFRLGEGERLDARRTRRHPLDVDADIALGMHQRHAEESCVGQRHMWRRRDRCATTVGQPVDHRPARRLVRHADLDAPHVTGAAVPEPVADGVLRRDPSNQPLPRRLRIPGGKRCPLVGVEVVTQHELAGCGVMPSLPDEHPSALGALGDRAARRTQQHRPRHVILGEPPVLPALDHRPHCAVSGPYLQVGGDGRVPHVAHPHSASQPVAYHRRRAEEPQGADRRGQQEPVRPEVLHRPVAEQLAGGVQERAGSLGDDELAVDALR